MSSSPGPGRDGEEPTDQDRVLADAAARDDAAAYLAALAQGPLFALVAHGVSPRVDGTPHRAAVDRTRRLRTRTRPARGPAIVLLTRGGVEVHAAAGPADRTRVLRALGGEQLAPLPGRTAVVVDPDTPWGRVLPVGEVHGALAAAGWTFARDHARYHRLWALRPVDRGSTSLRHALALGAVRQVLNGKAWNECGPWGLDLAAERRRFAAWWDVHDEEQWRGVVASLGSLRFTRAADPLLALREKLRDRQGHVDVAAWERVSRGWDTAHDVGPEESDARVAELRRVDAYEGLMREHGVLGAREQVRSLVAWDLGRGVNVVRDGLCAGWCEPDEAERLAIGFSDLARRCYRSWAEFGAAFTLARLLWSDDQWAALPDSARGVADSIAPLATLRADAHSPWSTLPFGPLD